MDFQKINLQSLQLNHSLNVNQATGGLEGSVEIPTPAGRAGFGPELRMSYSSSSGNSTFGIGWGLNGTPFITIDTKNGLPKYDGTDKYSFNGGLSLVPRLKESDGEWIPDITENSDFWIYYFIPSIEQGFTRFEKWVRKDDLSVHWRSYSLNNILTIYGLTNGKVFNPEKVENVFIWLIEAQYDNLGNSISYQYVSENGDNVDAFLSFETGRLKKSREVGFAKRYLDRILYGNSKPILPDQSIPADNEWHFEVVFDYGQYQERPLENSTAIVGDLWESRPDPISFYNAGFEIRNYRLCKRILTYHNIPDLASTSSLTGIFEMQYNEDVLGSTIGKIAYTGIRRELHDGSYSEKRLPELTFHYTETSLEDAFEQSIKESNVNVPQGLNASNTRIIDLFGEGLAGILLETNTCWYYKPNEGDGLFAQQAIVLSKPLQIEGAYTLGDFDNNGNLDVFAMSGRTAGYYEYDRHTESWSGFQNFKNIPQVSNFKYLDVNANGYPDLIVENEDKIVCYPYVDKDGFGDPYEFSKPISNGVEYAPMIGESINLDFFMSDMTGDGLPDQVQINNGRVGYFPNLGHGRFGELVIMENSPHFENDFNTDRIRLFDLDGSGTSDIVYIGKGELKFWYNASGNSFVEGGHKKGLPFIDTLSSVSIMNYLGNGIPCLVWSNSLGYAYETAIQYLQLTGGEIPRLIVKVENGCGMETHLEYGNSGAHYLESKKNGPWISKIPAHFTVVDKKIAIDTITNSKASTEFKYYDGHYDGYERSFICFGRVEQYDHEIIEDSSLILDDEYTLPNVTIQWFHSGMFGWDKKRNYQYYNDDEKQVFLTPQNFEKLDALNEDEFILGYRSLAGKIIRQEIFAVDREGQKEEAPYTISQLSYFIRRVQPGTEKDDSGFYAYQNEVLVSTYDQVSNDPQLSHNLVIEVDNYGNVLKECQIAYARRESDDELNPLQTKDYISIEVNQYLNVDNLSKHLIGIRYERKRFEVNHILRTADNLLQWQTVKDSFDLWVDNALNYDQSLPSSGNTVARLIDWNRTYFWNDDQDDVLLLGQTGEVALAHHDELACFNDGLITQSYGTKVSGSMLTDTDKGNYINHEGYWWQRTNINYYEDINGFYRLNRLEKLPGIFTIYEYDLHFLCITGITDPLGNSQSGVIDYNILQPYQLIDYNDNISEVLYDALGVVIVNSSYGTVLDSGSIQPYGNEPLTGYVRRSDETFENILAQPENYIQDASSFLYYDFESRPLKSINLIRENLYNDGNGNIENIAVIQIGLDYQDGFGRIVQNKRKVDPGLVIQFAADGTLEVDSSGEPLMAHSDERWLVDGHIVYNNKQLPVRQYEPFFSSTPDYESNSDIENFGVAIQEYYDALGRKYRTDFPNGTFTETLFNPWEIQIFDQNDTVDRSVYKVIREVLPTSSLERQALDKSLVHKETPTIIQFDPMGREIIKTEVNIGELDRNIETLLDYKGEVIQITDARGLIAFEYKRDMLGRLLYENSVDSGERWIYYDNHDLARDIWDSRDVHQHRTYDELGRPLSIHVDGALGLDNITESFLYGEDASISQAKERNLRGNLVKHFDPAGLQELELAAPGGINLLVNRRIINDYTVEPNWETLDLSLLSSDVFSSEYTFDGLGRKILESLPDQTTREYIYNEGGGIQKILISSSDGILSDLELVKNSSYDARGRRLSILLGNNVETAYSYNNETFKLERIRSRKTVGSPRNYQDINYTYDPVGNIIHHVDEEQQSTAATPNVLQGLNVSAHSEFEYDALYQLILASGRVHQSLLQHDYVDRSGQAGVPADWKKGTRHITLNNAAAIERYTRNYEYDAAGNVLKIKQLGSSNNWTKDIWTSGTSNHSLPLLDLNGIAIPSPDSHFDANGNCTYMPHLRALNWNYRNNISKAVIIDRSSLSKPNDEEYYVYGGDGMRIKKISQRVVDVANSTIELTEITYLDGCELKKVTRGGAEILERFTSHISDGINKVATIYSWQNDTLSRETDDVTVKKVHYQLKNHLGSTSLELDENGDVITYEEYYPFGGTSFIAGRSIRDIDLKTYRYSGKERDDFTGLYYFGYRYYAHWIGGWLSPDPLGPEDSVNLYMYVHNNPIMLIDPNGLETTGEIPETDGETSQTGITIRKEHLDDFRTRSEDARALLTEAYGEALAARGGAGYLSWHISDGHWVWLREAPVETGDGTGSGSEAEIDDEDMYTITVTADVSTESEEEGGPASDTATSDVGESDTPAGQTEGEGTALAATPDPESEHTESPGGGGESSSTGEGQGGKEGNGQGSSDEGNGHSRVPGQGLAYAGSVSIYYNPTGFTLEVPNNFDLEKIGIYKERILTDRGIGNRSALPGERRTPRENDTTSALRRENSALQRQWERDQRAAGNPKPRGHHTDHGAELQHIIRGDSTAGSNTVRYEDHRYQFGRDNTSQGSQAKNVRRRAVANGAPEDVPAGGVVKTEDMGLFRNSERARTFARRGGHVLTGGGVVLSWYGASQISDGRVRAVAYTASAAETAGVGAYYYGRVAMNGQNGFSNGMRVMSTGSRLMRVGGGVGMVVTSAYSGYEHYQQGEYGVLLGDGAGTGLGYMMLTQSASTPVVAVTGTAMAANYAGDYVESVVTPEYGRGAGIAAGTAVGLGIGAAVAGGLVAFGLVSNPVGWGILAVGGIAGLIGAVW